MTKQVALMESLSSNLRGFLNQVSRHSRGRIKKLGWTRLARIHLPNAPGNRIRKAINQVSKSRPACR